MINDLPLYQCHKTVRAAKINAIFLNPAPECSEGCQDGVLKLDGAAGSEVKVSAQYLNKHQPVVGGYYVRYEDGYESFSPAEAFEGGYVQLHAGPTYQLTVVTKTGKTFDFVTDKPVLPISMGEAPVFIDGCEVTTKDQKFDWAALQRLRKASA